MVKVIEKPRFGDIETIREFAERHPKINVEVKGWSMTIKGARPELLEAYIDLTGDTTVEFGTNIEWKELLESEATVGYY